MKFTAFVNSLSGSVPDDGRQQMEAVLNEHGWPCKFFTPQPNDFEDALNSCVLEPSDAVIVWGGDGTVSTLLQKLGNDGPPVIPLPGGTMNMLHQRVHGRVADWKTCLVESVLRRRPEFLPAARLGDRLMFVAALTGRLVGLARAREAVRSGEFAEIPRVLDLVETLNLDTAIAFRGDASGGPISGEATTIGVFVTEDRSKSQDGLDIITSDPDTLGELMRIGLQALTTPLARTEGICHQEAKTIVLDFDGIKTLPGTIDGEPMEFESGMEISFLPNAARVMGAGLT